MDPLLLEPKGQVPTLPVAAKPRGARLLARALTSGPGRTAPSDARHGGGVR